jgi:hypothetical protein
MAREPGVAPIDSQAGIEGRSCHSRTRRDRGGRVAGARRRGASFDNPDAA